MTALYIHWPFCKKKCPYCDFNSHVREAVEYERWSQALLQEMRTMRNLSLDKRLTSIFFGGGTPSLMPPFIVEALLNEAVKLWNCAQDIEITLEANPTSAEAKNFVAYRKAGVNRLSLGVQSLIDDELAFLGREHSAKEALAVLDLVAQHFPRYSFDLIYARPKQTVKAWRKELSQALHHAHGHVSLYQLTVEPDTPFARIYAKGGFTLPDADVAAELYEETQSLCSKARLERYEVSNYAVKGQESQHNLSYWRGDAYVGIGAGAHGRYRDATGGWHATEMIKSPERWIASVEREGHGLADHVALSDTARAEEYLLSGLRLREGVVLEQVKSVLDHSKLAQLHELGLIEVTAERLCVTYQGELVVERVIGELLAG